MRRPPTRRVSALVPALLLTAALQGAGSPAQGAPAPRGDVRLAPAETAIPDSWIVALKPDTTSTVPLAHELTHHHGGRLTHVYRTALNGFSAHLTHVQARRLALDPRVAYVEQDSKVTIADEQPDPTWGLDRIDQRELPLDNTYA